jgi:hypothetical protein
MILPSGSVRERGSPVLAKVIVLVDDRYLSDLRATGKSDKTI